jgi:hypothetical protein
MLPGSKDGSKVGSIYQLSMLKRTESGVFKGRKAIPQAARAEYPRRYGPGVEATFWSPAGTDPRPTKADYVAWPAQIERRIAALREAGGPAPRQMQTRRVIAEVRERARDPQDEVR